MTSPVSNLPQNAVPFAPRPVAPDAGSARWLTDYLDMHFDTGLGALWCYLKPEAPVCFTPKLIAELRQTQRSIATRHDLAVPHYDPDRLRFQVIASRIPEVFSLGGDLAHFLRLIRDGQREQLYAYAKEAMELVYSTATGHGQSINTIALVRGLALGGGFEAVLSADVIIAERGVKMGFPEILFNMFPGMGAYSLLRRRVSHIEAERIILSGSNYDAEELHRLGIVDFLAEPGEGERVAMDYMKRNQARSRGRSAFRRSLEAAHPVDRQELLSVLDVWTDTAMSLDDKDLRVMEFLVRNQVRYAARSLGDVEVV